MSGIALLLLAASVGHGLARWLRLPAVPFLVLAGFGLGLSGGAGETFLQDALVLGITFLVFAAGIELDASRVRHKKRAALAVGFAQFALLGGLGWLAALALGFEGQTAAYLALALTASSTLVAVRVLQQRRQLFEPFGRMVIGVLLLQDLLVILLIPVLTGLPEGVLAVARGVGSTLLLAGAGWLVRKILPRLLRRLALDEELLLLIVLSHLFAFLFLADQLGVPLVSGAFVAGVALSSFPLNGVVRGRLTSIGDFFTAIFFAALGATLGIPTVDEVIQSVVLGLVVIVVTPLAVAAIAERSGISARPAIVSGLLLSQTSEFSLVVGLQGVALGHLAPGAFHVIALVTLGTMVLTPLLVRDGVVLRLLHLHPSRGRRGNAQPPRDHVLLIGCGTSGTALLETMVIGPHPIVVVDDDPGVVARLRAAGIDAYRGDATDPGLLERVGAAHARVVVSTMGRAEDHTLLLEETRGVPTFVRAFEAADAEWLRERGAHPVGFGDAAAATFLDWYDRRGWESPDELDDEEFEDVL
jgi:CPA2 family monovalent cation:H+ antiporter-2